MNKLFPKQVKENEQCNVQIIRKYSDLYSTLK